MPRARLALVGVPVSGDLAVARAAVDALLARFAGREPEALVELRDAALAPRSRTSAGPGRRSSGPAGSSAEWQLAVDPTLPERMRSLVARVCPEGGDCLSPANQLRLHRGGPRHVRGVGPRDAVGAGRAGGHRARTSTSSRASSSPVPEAVRRRALEKIGELEAIGFRVVRVPAFRVDLDRPRAAGRAISYVNALVVDQQVFVPRFGLGEVEDRLFRDVGAQLPPGYSIVPIDAQQVLIRNGGLHCLAGLVR